MLQLLKLKQLIATIKLQDKFSDELVLFVK